MTTSALKRYDITQTPFYKLQSKKKLAELLNLPSVAVLNSLTRLEAPYRKFEVPNKNKSKQRLVQMPSNELYPIHARIFKLLKRIELPDYLHSGVQGRSYITNAKAHLGQKTTYALDIKSFYPSVTKPKVFNLFRDVLKCSDDVAGILAEITTCDGYIPTGSSLSQLLAYLSCKKMFDELHLVCRAEGAVMTCYVDDLTFSGEKVSRSWIYTTVKPIISKFGFKSHKDKFFKTGQPKEITGVIVDGHSVKVCHRHHQAIRDLMLAIPETEDPAEINKVYEKLIGRLSSIAQINPSFKSRKTAALQEYKSIRN